MELRGRTALVTGGAVRVGRAISLAVAERGARLVIHYNGSADDAEAAVAEIRGKGGEAVAIQADLRSMREVERLAGEAGEAFGPVDLLVNNASIFPAAGFEEVDEDLWDATLEVNLKAPFFLTQRLGGAMKRGSGGLIVNLGDLAGLQAWAGYAAHAISKAGLLHLTRLAARALAPEVRVAAIVPGTVLPPDSYTRHEVDRLAARAALQRIGSPDDVVRALLYLVDADFVTGEMLVVDGGRLLK